MKRLFIGLVLVAFLVACGSTPLPVEQQKPPEKEDPKTALERIIGDYIGDFTLEEPFTLDTPPITIGGDFTLTINKDGSFEGKAQKKYSRMGSVQDIETAPEEGIITGKITDISEFGTSGTLELEAKFPVSGNYSGTTNWTNNSSYVVASFYEKNIDDSNFLKFEIRVLKKEFLE